LKARVEVGAIVVGPGRHLLTVRTRRPFDGARHSEHMLRLVGEDWRFVEKELPHYVLRLEPTLQDGLPGGFVRV
jgi:hypothetical protein